MSTVQIRSGFRQIFLSQSMTEPAIISRARRFPACALLATTGEIVDPAGEPHDARVIVYFYPRTRRPGHHTDLQQGENRKCRRSN